MIGTVLLSIAGFVLSSFAGLYAGRVFCAGMEPLPDGPPPSNPHPELVLIVAGILGAYTSARGLPPVSLGIFALVCGVLSAIWYADLSRGTIPDPFTLLPLGAIGVAAALSGRWEIIASAVIPAIPFIIMAALSHGRGLGWGDAKLAALGGALIGMQNAVLGFGIACIFAIVIARFRPDRTRPIAFAPYMVLAIAVPLALQGH